MTADLVAFLRARLDETAAEAEAAAGSMWLPVDGWLINEDMHLCEVDDGPTLEHIARHDPARVLADTDAKRELLSRYEAMEAGVLILTGVDSILSEYRRVILPQLALPYADHSDYREEWRP